MKLCSTDIIILHSDLAIHESIFRAARTTIKCVWIITQLNNNNIGLDKFHGWIMKLNSMHYTISEAKNCYLEKVEWYT